MKHNTNRIFCALLTVLLCVGFLLGGVPSVHAASGTAGDNLAWTLENGTLIISGDGAIADYTDRSLAPWMAHADSIQRVVIEKGVTAVGKMAFYCCPNLTTVILADSVNSLGEQAFAGCRKLAQINLPAVESIGRGCFYECLSLMNITLGNKLHTIEEKAFYRCESLSGITIPASVTKFGNSMFTYCSSLVYVKIEAKLKTLPYWTFYGCDVLWELYLPDEVETVEVNALVDCPNLAFVDYGGSDAVKKEIQKQLDQDTGYSDAPVPSVDYEQTPGAIITTTLGQNPDTGALQTTVDATVTDSSGWNDMTNSTKEEYKQGIDTLVDVYVQGDIPMPDGTLNGIADKDVTINIHTSDNVDWQIVLPDQEPDNLKGKQDFGVSISKNKPGKYAKEIGKDTESYSVTLGKTTLNSTVLLPMGPNAARRVATLYAVDGFGLRRIGSVIVDDDGRAAFSLAGTSGGRYVVALDAQNIPQDETRIPEKLAGDYDITYGATLTDAYGNQYVLTGRVNKLGFGLGTLTLIVLGVLVVTGVVVGIIMTLWNKQKKKLEALGRKR